MFGKLISKVVIPDPDNPLISQFVDDSKKDRELPGFGITLFTILLPVALMLIGSWADLFFAPKTFANDFLRLIGNSVIALLIATLVSFWTFGRARGFGADQILKFTNECLAPIASITLVVGAGAGFGRILMDGGVSKAIVGIATDAHLSPLILGWFVAALIRVATGSATVAMTTACGIVAPIVSTVGGVRPELMVLATGAGSLILSHVNDGGFWLVKEYFNMTVPQTFKTWTVMETLVSVLALLFTLALGDGVCA
jgi:GntP family gluconate:H+ symporter